MLMKNIIATSVTLIILIILSIFLIERSNKDVKVESTDLSLESISGISLSEKYDSDKVAQVLGNNVRKSIVNNHSNYEYVSNDFIVGLEVDKDKNIVAISMATSQKNNIKTIKGVTNTFSFNDVTKLYGQNYVKKQWKDDMGSGDGYSITYFDKINRYKIEFGFSKIQDNETMSNISLSVY